jgi:hypothetical protein
MMTIQITCPGCGSGINLYPGQEKAQTECDICKHQMEIHFKPEHAQNKLCDCVVCERKDFYQQRDFNRKIGVILFVIAAILSIWTYGLSLLVLYFVDLFLFRKLPSIAICYKCKTVYRNVQNLSEIPDFNHEMNDRIVYADHDFKGKPLSH